MLMFDKYGNEVSLLDYQVGDIFITTNDVNPSIRFGGTWERFAKGRTLIGFDEDDDDFKTVKQIGGEKTHKLSIDEMPIHTHGIIEVIGGNIGSYTHGPHMADSNYSDKKIWGADNSPITSSGNSFDHNNMSPYIVVYIWIKIS